MKFPNEFETRMRRLLGDEYDAFADAYDLPPTRGLHVNLCKMSTDELLSAVDFPISPLEFSSESFAFECNGIGNHPLHHAGAIYVQEPSAMFPMSMLGATGFAELDHPRVLDMCASPGGKSSQAANLLAKGGGFLLSNEYVPNRALTLAENIERLGIIDAAVTNLPSDVLADKLGECFDLTIVDAPCSGEGMFRKDENAVSEWSTKNVEMSAARQRDILKNAAKTVKNGGFLLYSTCTFSLDENEQNVAWFLREYPEFEPIMPSERVKNASSDGISIDRLDMSFCRRVYPHSSIGEGQFAALLHKKGTSDGEIIPNLDLPSPSRADEIAAREFLSSTIGDRLANSMRLVQKKDGVYIVSPHAILPDLGVLSPGVKLGEIRKGRLVPHHRFFMAYGGNFINRFELDIDAARDYIGGLELDCNAFNGYGVVTFHGATLGGVKVSAGRAKNHYPKGLRLR